MLERLLAADDAAFDRNEGADGMAVLSGALVSLGSLDEAGSLLEEALTILEAEQAWPQLARALVSRGVPLATRFQREESIALLRHALRLCEEHDLPQLALRTPLATSPRWRSKATG